MTQNSLAKILGTFKIHSKDIRVTGSVGRGFEFSQFDDVFLRYIPNIPIQSTTVLQANNSKPYGDSKSATSSTAVALQKPLQPMNNKESSTVALKNTTLGGVAKFSNDEEVFL